VIIHMELSYDSQEELIANICEEALGEFPILYGSKFTVVFRLPIKDLDQRILHNLKMYYDEESILSKSRIYHPARSQDTLIEIFHVSNEVSIKSYKFNFDEPAIWIGNKLERYLKLTILVRNPEKIKQAKSQFNTTLDKKPHEEPTVKEIIKEKQVIVKIRCSYCKSTYDESLDRCPFCGGKN